MKKVFIINGAAGVGKDTFVEIAKYKIFIKTGLPTYNISSVDNVKTAAKILGWDGEKDARGRKFLSDLKIIHNPLIALVILLKREGFRIFIFL